MDIKSIMIEIHETAKSKGWYDGRNLEFAETIALCHSELSEALELHRSNYHVTDIKSEETEQFGQTKPIGIPIEFADTIIRILDFCDHSGIDIEKAIEVKMAYNQTRKYRHGGKLI